jgi:dGTPase
LLDECLRDEGGFSHNAQALRLVRELEFRCHEYSGLNLSREVLEGQGTRITHDESQERPLLEVQVVEAADSIAYNSHDADDALELGLLSLDELLTTRLWSDAAARVHGKWSALDSRELRRAVLHELIDWQVSDLLSNASAAIEASGVDSPQAVRRSRPIAVVSEELAKAKRELESFLRQRVYRHSAVLAHRQEATSQLRAMFDLYVARPELMSENFRRRTATVGLRRTVGDYIAGMTDRFAAREYSRLLSRGPSGLATPPDSI